MTPGPTPPPYTSRVPSQTAAPAARGSGRGGPGLPRRRRVATGQPPDRVGRLHRSVADVAAEQPQVRRRRRRARRGGPAPAGPARRSTRRSPDRGRGPVDRRPSAVRPPAIQIRPSWAAVACSMRASGASGPGCQAAAPDGRRHGRSTAARRPAWSARASRTPATTTRPTATIPSAKPPVIARSRTAPHARRSKARGVAGGAIMAVHGQPDRVARRPEHASAPNSWGLGDGQGIPWEYAPAPEARDIVKLKERYGLFINGREVQATGGETFISIDPSTEQPLAAIAKATARRHRQGGPRRPTRPAPVVGPAVRPGAGQVPVPDQPHPPGAQSASSPSSSRWTRASRSRSRATSTSRWRPATSGTTPAGRTSSTTRSRVGSPGRSASPPRSSRGTSRC